MMIEDLLSISTLFYLLFVYHQNIHTHTVREKIISVCLTRLETDMSLSTDIALSYDVLNIYMQWMHHKIYYLSKYKHMYTFRRVLFFLSVFPICHWAYNTYTYLWISTRTCRQSLYLTINIELFLFFWYLTVLDIHCVWESDIFSRKKKRKC